MLKLISVCVLELLAHGACLHNEYTDIIKMG